MPPVLERIRAFWSRLSPQFFWAFGGYFALALVSHALLEYTHYPTQSAANLAIKVVLRASLLAAGVVGLLSLKPRVGRWIHLALMVVLLPSLFANATYFILYGSVVNAGALASAYLTDWHEATGYLATFWPQIVGGLAAVGVLVPFYWKVHFDQIGRAGRQLCLGIVVVVLGYLAVDTSVTALGADDPIESATEQLERRAFEQTFFLASDISAGATFLGDLERFEAAAARMADASFDIEPIAERQPPQTAVVIIGESLARSHMSLYGYPRPTTPRLEAWSQKPGFYRFDDVISPTTLTRTTLMRALTTGSNADLAGFYDGKSIVAAANSAGYETFWLSNQGIFGVYDMEATAIARQSDETRFVNTDFRLPSMDGKLLPELDAVLADPAPRKFIVLHMVGSHMNYKRRFPEEFAHFEGIDDLRERLPWVEDDDELRHLNDYDNSVRYTDHVVAEVLERVAAADDRAVVVFAPDHGEELYDVPDAKLGHGFPGFGRGQVEIPMLVWLSPAFQAANPTLAERVEEATERPFTVEHLFYPIVDLLGVSSPEWDETMSPFAEPPPTYRRTIVAPDRKTHFEYEPGREFYR